MDDQTDLFGSPEMNTAAKTGVAIIPLTAEMVPLVAELHSDAFAGYMNTRIGRAYVRALMNWFRQAERAVALAVIDNDGKVIGYVVGAPLGYNKSMNRDLLWVAAMGIFVRPWLFFKAQVRSAVMDRLRLILARSVAEHAEPMLPQPTMSLVGICVSPLARGKKIGLRLMRAFEARARELQMRSLRLSVYSDNTVARQLYERCGWQQFPSSVKEKGLTYYFRVLVGELDDRETKP